MSNQPENPTGPKGWADIASEYGVTVATFRKWFSKDDWKTLIDEGYVPYSGYILKPRVVAKIYEILGHPKQQDIFA